MEKELARFTVRILSNRGATWQGEVMDGDTVFRFESEMQLLRWLWDRYPAINPETGGSHIRSQQNTYGCR